MTAPANDPAIDIDALLLEFRIMLRNIDSEQVNSYGHKEKKFFPKKIRRLLTDVERATKQSGLRMLSQGPAGGEVVKYNDPSISYLVPIMSDEPLMWRKEGAYPDTVERRQYAEYLPKEGDVDMLHFKRYIFK